MNCKLLLIIVLGFLGSLALIGYFGVYESTNTYERGYMQGVRENGVILLYPGQSVKLK